MVVLSLFGLKILLGGKGIVFVFLITCLWELVVTAQGPRLGFFILRMVFLGSYPSSQVVQSFFGHHHLGSSTTPECLDT
jgi:hypothetical protein